MTEDNIIIEDYEVEYKISEEQPEATSDITIEVIEVDDVETIYVDAEDAFSALGEPNEQLRHQLLTGRDASDQHPIIAITGLREELNDIESLKTVYSNGKQLADYYKWEDGNPLGENRVGYFVSICNDIRTIKICDDENVFGIIIDNAAFVGGQDDITRDYNYGLVLYSGVADVRCELDVEVGSYVLSNSYGVAKLSKSGYGYEVVALTNKNGVKYATVLLNSTANQMDTLGENLNVISERMNDAEANIATVMNVANEAYNMANASREEALGKAEEALGKVDEVLISTEILQSQIQSSIEKSVQAQAIANSAATSAENIRQDAEKVANNALTNVNNLIARYEPLEEWVDPETGKIGATYVIDYMNANGLATTADIRTVDDKTQENKSSIERNAENFTSLVSSVDKYSVGEYSQAYGLTREQAQSILKPGYIYIPTKHSNTKVSHEEIFVGETEINSFTPGNYYVWGINDQGNVDWIECNVGTVWINSSEPANSGGTYKYWYIDSSTAPDNYEPYALYTWESTKNQWVKVNTLSGNANNRITSMIRQTANEIAAEVTNAQGDIAGLNLKIEENKSAQAALVASVVNTDGTVNAASIINSVNNSGSSVAIKANHIILDGYTANGNGTFSIDQNGHMIASGGKIAEYTISGDALYGSQVGMCANPGTHYAFWAGAAFGDSANASFRVSHTGELKATKAEITGTITAETGYIGNWMIDQGSLYNQQANGDSLRISCGTDTGSWIIAYNAEQQNWPFWVEKNGKLHATGVDIEGAITATSGYIGGETGWSIGNNSFHNGLPSRSGVGTRGMYLGIDGISYRAIEGELYGRFDFDINYGFLISASAFTEGLNFEKFKGLGDNTPQTTALNMANGSKAIDLRYDVNGDGHVTREDVRLIQRYKQGYDDSKFYSPAVTNLSMTGLGIIYQNVMSDKVIFGCYPGGVLMSEVTTATMETSDTSSDEKVKNNIELLNDNYDILFDNLIPRRFKYNHGTSDRFHTGFIAQEIVEALEKSNLTTQDFATVIHLDDPLNNGAEWALRKEEMVALNTWQIQKLKARVAELEEKIKRLEV